MALVAPRGGRLPPAARHNRGCATGGREGAVEAARGMMGFRVSLSRLRRLLPRHQRLNEPADSAHEEAERPGEEDAEQWTLVCLSYNMKRLHNLIKAS